ncbi:hypothetical protein BN2537_969 [Streptomyces venezuelae]|nr:hypothetical protein BN2537_969 [Streptomyces venezuelae]
MVVLLGLMRPIVAAFTTGTEQAAASRHHLPKFLSGFLRLPPASSGCLRFAAVVGRYP